jgi:hypothetical protein
MKLSFIMSLKTALALSGAITASAFSLSKLHVPLDKVMANAKPSASPAIDGRRTDTTGFF